MQQRRNRPYGRRNNNRNNNRNRGGNNSGGGGKRFNAKQVENKRDNYLNLHKEHFSSDRVKAEFYLQHAEHYQRLLNAHAEEMEAQRGEDYEDDFDDAAEDAEDTASEEMEAEEAEEKEKPQQRRQQRPQRKPAPVAAEGDEDSSSDIGTALPGAIATN